jgi:hypothetical protein
MSKWIVVAVFLVAGGAAACGGGGSGISGDKELVSLSAGEINTLCEYLIKVEGPERRVDCGNGISITVGRGTVADCVSTFQDGLGQFPSCDATVDDAESCSEDFGDLTDAELCSDPTLLPRSCEPLISCGTL